MRLWTILCIVTILLAIPVSADYAVWVADTHRGVVKMYVDDNGVEYLGRNPDIRRPSSVAIDSKGRIWVASVMGQTVHLLDPDTFDEEFVMEGFGLVTDIAVDPVDDTVVVLDQGRSEIAKVAPNAIVLWRTRVSVPLSIDVNPISGDIWVGGRDKIFKLDGAGNVIKEYRGMVNRAEDIEIDPVTNNIWVANVWHSEVLQLNQEGTVLTRTKVRSPKQLALNIPFGGVAVLDKLNRQIHFIDEKGLLFRTISDGVDNPWAISIDPQEGHLWLATNTNDRATLKRYSVDGGVLLHNMAGFFIPSDLAFDFSETASTSNTYFPTNKEVDRPQIPSMLSTPLFEEVMITEEEHQGDKGLWRSSLREYMNSPVHAAQFKAYDKRITAAQVHAPARSVSATLYNYCQLLLKEGRDPFKYAPFQQPVREHVFLAECAGSYEVLGFYGGFIPYTEPAIDVTTLSPIPSIEEIKDQTIAPFQDARGDDT